MEILEFNLTVHDMSPAGHKGIDYRRRIGLGAFVPELSTHVFLFGEDGPKSEVRFVGFILPSKDGDMSVKIVLEDPFLDSTKDFFEFIAKLEDHGWEMCPMKELNNDF